MKTSTPPVLTPIGSLANRPEPQLAYTVQQAASNLGIGRTTLYSLIQAGELTPLKLRQRTVSTEGYHTLFRLKMGHGMETIFPHT